MAELDLKNSMYRSWFCTFNNPSEFGFNGTPQEICDDIISSWIDGHPTRSCAVAYCISAEGLHHCHVVLEDTKNMRFSVVKKAFPSMHIEPTKGNKQQAEDYINKRGKWEEKGETIIATARYGEIKGSQGQRKDFEIIDDLLQQGKTPLQIYEQNFSFRRYEKMIKQAYYDKRKSETPLLRDVSVYWHVGESGSGKTYEFIKLCDKHGEDSVYLVNDYGKGGLDNYCGQPILCMDEFRGQMPFSLLMNYLDKYRVQIPCRYSNGYALWNEVHIFTVMPPELVYNDMVEKHKGIDTYEQLLRRLTAVIYHYKDYLGNFNSISLQADKYTTYEDLVSLSHTGNFIEVTEQIPF